MARTAVVAGTATAVSNRVSRRQANRWAEQDTQAYGGQQQYAEPQYAEPPPPAAPESTGAMPHGRRRDLRAFAHRPRRLAERA